MMKSYRYIIGIIWAFAVLSFSACSDDDYLSSGNGKNVSVTFLPRLDDKLNTRAIGDAAGIDQLTVVVYEGSETLSKFFSFSQDWDIAQRNGVTLTLIEGRSYKILFWAENRNNSVYDLTDDGRISVDYTNYINGGFAMMEDMDAFYGISEVIVGSQRVEDKGTVTLFRPLAQLNFADKAIQPEPGIHKAIVTFHSIPSSFNPFTREVAMTDADNDGDDVIFTFTDFPTNEALTVDGTPYYYVSSNYLFAPSIGTTSVSVTLDLQFHDGTSINKFEFKGEQVITLEQNKKTNVLGAIVQKPQTWSIWDGKSQTQPAQEEGQNQYIIDEASDLAWLQTNGHTLVANSTFVLRTDIDMDNHEISSLELPTGSTIKGEKHIIKNLRLGGALLGDATLEEVNGLVIENAVVNYVGNAKHIGVLVNTLTGGATFTDISIKNSSITTSNGAAGGLVGYIRKEVDGGSTPLKVAFNSCSVENTIVSGSLTEGHFVGLFRGYDNSEQLIFNNTCSLVTSIGTESVSSYYTDLNKAAWYKTPYASAEMSFDKYSGWLGNEECYRGKVYYGEGENARYIPKWDGKTKITPLIDTDGAKLIYSAFDLASLQGGSHTAVIFKEDVDLGGDCNTESEKTHLFTPIASISTLDGKSKSIFNLYISVSTWIGGFINQADGTTVHRNLTFHNPTIIVNTVPNEEYRYTGTLCPYINSGNYTASDIKVKTGYIKGLSKVGGLIGFITAGCESATITNCSVEESQIENVYLEVEGESFPASGEVGGLIGFISAKSSSSLITIENSYVAGTSFNCCTYNAGIWDRSVGQFIGDIRTQNGETVKIIDCWVANNDYTDCTTGKKADFDRASWRQGLSRKYTDLVGQCYHVNLIFMDPRDKKGKVYLVVDGTETKIYG